MHHKSDGELLPEYYFGKNEPVGIWIDRNFKALLFTGFKITREKSMIQDGIQDVAVILCEYKKEERPERFDVNQGNVQGALRRRLRFRLIDIVRSNVRRRELIDVNKVMFHPPEVENDTEDFFEMNREKLEEYKKTLPPEEQQFLDSMQKHGFGKLAPIAKELGIDKNKARTIRQRIRRKIKRNLVILPK